MAGIIGQIGEFEEGKEEFVNYVERVEQYFLANDVSTARQISVFLTVIGPATYSLVKSLVSPQKPSDKTIIELTTALQNHYTPKPLTIAERFKFHKRDQQPNENIANYVVELKKLASTCVYGDFLNEALRDRFVCGLLETRMQRRLLAETDLTFSKAIKIASAMEMANKQAMEFQPQQSTSFPDGSSSRQVNKVYSRPNSNTKPMYTDRPIPNQGMTNNSPCYRCLDTSHTPDMCPFISSPCYYCKKIGHIAKACRKKNKPGKPKFSKGQGQNSDTVKLVEETKLTYNDDDSFEVYTIFSSNSNKHGVMVDVELAGKSITLELDTGAAVSLISDKLYKSKLADIPLQPSKVKLRTYSGEYIEVLGKLTVPVKYDKQEHNLPLYVVAGDKPALFGREWLKTIKLNWAGIFSVQFSTEEIIASHKSVFKDQIGVIHDFKAHIEVPENAKPSYFKPRSVPYALKEKVEKELRRLETLGVITKIDRSDWASPIVVVPKADGSIRLCGDYKVSVNKVIQIEQYPLPTAEDLFATLAGGKVFSKLDLSNAYLQLELDDQSKQYLPVNTHLGLFQFNRLAFGIASAPAIFQGTMDKILQGIPRVCCYLDDILIAASSEQEHNKILKEVLSRLENYNITVKRHKCELKKSSVEYLGHRVDADGLHPTTQKLDAIKQAPTPTNLTELKSYLGLLNYYGKFLPNLSSVIQPLNNLQCKGVKWEWTAACKDAFIESKKLLLNSTLLVHYDAKKPLRLQCDASHYGIGAVISHIMPNGEERPIAFASRTLTKSEKNYAHIEKEALSLIFGVKKYHKYLYGRRFVLVTDHKPLTAILNPKAPIPTLAAARMQRWALILSAYLYDIEYRKSADHGNADALSRLPCKVKEETEDLFYFSYVDELPITSMDISKATQRDPVLSRIFEFIMNGWPNYVDDEDLKPYFIRKNELSSEKGCILWGLRVIIPPTYREQIIKDLHQQHSGMCHMKSLARSYLWWPNLDRQIEEQVRACVTCSSVSNSPAVAPLQPWAWPTHVWERLHVDYAELDKQHLFIVIDSNSKWLEVFPMSTTTAEKTIDILRSLFARYGLPKEIVSDNGPQFTSEDFHKFTSQNGIKHTRVPPYHPASNGAAERSVQIVKKALVKQMLDGDPRKRQLSLQHKLANFLITYRNTPQTTTGRSPAELFLKRQPRTRFSLLKPNLADTVKSKQDDQKRFHDRCRVKLRNFEINQWVRVKDTRGTKIQWWPGRVTRVCGPRTYLVKMSNSHKTRYVHIDHLLPSVEVHVPDMTPGHDVPEVEVMDSPVEPTTAVSNSHSEVDPTPQPPVVQNTPERRYPVRIRKAPERLDL